MKKKRCRSISDAIIVSRVERMISSKGENDFDRAVAFYAFLSRIYSVEGNKDISVSYSKIEKYVFEIWQQPYYLSDVFIILEDCGLIEVTRNPPNTNTYTLVHPDEALKYYYAVKEWVDKYTIFPSTGVAKKQP